MQQRTQSLSLVYRYATATMTRFPRTVALVLLLAVATIAQASAIVPLNDTGQTLCYNSAGAVIGCASSGLDDGRYGRDAAASAGQLTKTGAGAAGFDFSKIANNGSVLLASATLGVNPTDWACTRDNVTGLIWEVKTSSGLRSSAHTYSWYSIDATTNGGNPGSLGANSCDSTLSSYADQCNTANYVAAVNAIAPALCGYSDWRLPSLRELQSLVDFSVPATGTVPTLDANYFPNTQPHYFWSASSFASGPGSAWFLLFDVGSTPGAYGKTSGLFVRLVRGGQ